MAISWWVYKAVVGKELSPGQKIRHYFSSNIVLDEAAKQSEQSTLFMVQNIQNVGQKCLTKMFDLI